MLKQQALCGSLVAAELKTFIPHHKDKSEHERQYSEGALEEIEEVVNSIATFMQNVLTADTTPEKFLIALENEFLYASEHWPGKAAKRGRDLRDDCEQPGKKRQKH